MLPFIDWRLGLLICLFAVFVNGVILPRTTLAKDMYRSGEGWTGGIVLYPATIAFLFAIYREATLPIAVAWVVLACGDPAAAFFGQRTSGESLPWNGAKTWNGLLAFVVFACPPGILVCLQQNLAWGESLALAMVASLTGALVESVPWRLADNFAIGQSVALVVALLGAVL